MYKALFHYKSRQTDRQTDNRQTDRQIDNRQTDRQTDNRQTDRQTDRQNNYLLVLLSSIHRSFYLLFPSDDLQQYHDKHHMDRLYHNMGTYKYNDV